MSGSKGAYGAAPRVASRQVHPCGALYMSVVVRISLHLTEQTSSANPEALIFPAALPRGGGVLVDDGRTFWNGCEELRLD